MQIQSLSICVPGGCVNKCKFCVSRMHEEKNYINQIEKNTRFRDLYKKDYKKRIAFARDNGCNTVMLTGDGEPLINKKFIEDFFEWNDHLNDSFRWIEIQTSGAMLDDEYLRFLRNGGVNTISLSLSSVFSDEENYEYNCPVKKEFMINIEKLCAEIKRYDFNLRLSLNMTDWYNKKNAAEIFERVKSLGANQVTFRVLYKSGTNNPQDLWIDEHKCVDSVINEIKDYVKTNGKALEILPFGATKYSVGEISTVIDDDCMNTKVGDTLKYLIIRPDCKLYSKWDDKGSLIF